MAESRVFARSIRYRSWEPTSAGSSYGIADTDASGTVCAGS
ncbi:hypothetical protein [Amycolatopsis kentuckyensis]|nr:hypothetical protein [Amycolatopsis kentuckyensis]